MYKFTIIIPHRNIIHLLQRCLASIPQRDDIQVIIVDDNSNEGVVDLNHFAGYSRKNTEIYLTKEGKGAGYARNVGLQHAKGEWILFADADDVFLPAIELLFNMCEKETADIIYFVSCAKDELSGKDADDLDKEKNFLCNYTETNKEKLGLIHHPWGKIFHSSFLQKYNLMFEETLCSNDTRFSVLSHFYAQKIQVFPIVAYCYMIRPNSLWHNVNLDWAKTRFEVMLNIAKFMKRNKEYKTMEYYSSEARMYLYKIKAFSKKIYYYYIIRYILFTGFRIQYLKSIFSVFNFSQKNVLL